VGSILARVCVAVKMPRGLLLAFGSEEAHLRRLAFGRPTCQLSCRRFPPGERSPSNDTTPPPPPPLAGRYARPSPGKPEVSMFFFSSLFRKVGTRDEIYLTTSLEHPSLHRRQIACPRRDAYRLATFPLT
jgi:hypothetical protein